MKNETMKGRLLRSSVLAGVATSVAAIAAPAYAQDDGVEEIFVTGSRIAQSSYTGVNPVVVIDAEAIEKSGQVSVADILRDSNINTFGSQREQSGNAQQSQASISLRGFGNTRTLVMLDGFRIAASPKIGGAVVNVNALPTAAIERVDILTGAASSIYGSDAAAGVVNVILKDSYDGLTVSGMRTWNAEEGGEEMKASLVTGFESDRARVMIALDYAERDIIYRSDRWYDGSANLDQFNFDEAVGVSYYSRNFISYGDSPALGSGLADRQIYPRSVCLDNPDMVNNGQIYYSPGSNGHMCAYDFTPIMAYHASRQFGSAVTKFAYDVTDDIEFKLRAMHNRSETFGRYAPVAGYYWAEPGTVELLVINGGDTSGLGAFDPTDPNTYEVVPNDVGGYVYNRFIENGPRATTTVDTMTDVLLELVGDYGDYTWNLDAQYTQQEYSDIGSGYIGRELFQRALAGNSGFRDPNPDYNDPIIDPLGLLPTTVVAPFDPSDPRFVDYYALTISALAKSNYRHLGGGVGGPVAFVPGLEFYTGAEYYEYDFENDFDDQSSAGQVMGSAGNDEAGDRQVAAVYAEFQYNEVENLDLSGSARYDSYSDFGNTTTYKVGGSYDIAAAADMAVPLTFRASYGTGFIAPDLGTLYAADSFSAERMKDVADCDISGTVVCPTTQKRTNVHGNDQLGAETSTNLTVGFITGALDGDFRLRADYYYTEVDDVIRYVSLQGLAHMQLADCANGTTNLQDLMDSNPDIFIDRNGLDVCAVTAPIVGRSDTTSLNSGSFNSSGIDLDANLVRDYDFGSLTFNAAATYVLEFEDEEYYNGPSMDFIGFSDGYENAYPQWRGNFRSEFARGDHSIAATVSYVDGYTEDRGAGADIDSWTTYDVRYTWQSPWDSTISVGCRNCTNEEPPLNPRQEHNDRLHNIYGQVGYLAITANF